MGGPPSSTTACLRRLGCGEKTSRGVASGEGPLHNDTKQNAAWWQSEGCSALPEVSGRGVSVSAIAGKG